MDNSQCPSCSIKTGVEHERFWRVEVDEVDYFLVDRDALLELADELQFAQPMGRTDYETVGKLLDAMDDAARRIRESLGVEDA